MTDARDSGEGHRLAMTVLAVQHHAERAAEALMVGEVDTARAELATAHIKLDEVLAETDG